MNVYRKLSLVVFCAVVGGGCENSASSLRTDPMDDGAATVAGAVTADDLLSQSRLTPAIPIDGDRLNTGLVPDALTIGLICEQVNDSNNVLLKKSWTLTNDERIVEIFMGDLRAESGELCKLRRQAILDSYHHGVACVPSPYHDLQVVTGSAKNEFSPTQLINWNGDSMTTLLSFDSCLQAAKRGVLRSVGGQLLLSFCSSLPSSPSFVNLTTLDLRDGALRDFQTFENLGLQKCWAALHRQ